VKKPNTPIYSEIKQYKMDRLFYSSYFRSLWYGTVEPKLSQRQYEYKIATHCWLQCLNEADIVFLIAAWYKKHGIAGSMYFVRHNVVPDTYTHTRETVNANKKKANSTPKAQADLKASNAKASAKRKADRAVAKVARVAAKASKVRS